MSLDHAWLWVHAALGVTQVVSLALVSRMLRNSTIVANPLTVTVEVRGSHVVVSKADLEEMSNRAGYAFGAGFEGRPNAPKPADLTFPIDTGVRLR